MEERETNVIKSAEEHASTLKAKMILLHLEIRSVLTLTETVSGKRSKQKLDHSESRSTGRVGGIKNSSLSAIVVVKNNQHQRKAYVATF